MDSRLQQVFQRVFRVNTLHPESSPETVPGWDSLAHLALISELEREFRINLTPDEVLEMINVRTICDVLKERGVYKDNGCSKD